MYAEELTPREMETLRLLALGLSTSEIAQEMEIATRTARNHLTAIYAKMRVLSGTEAVVLAIADGLVDVQEAKQAIRDRYQDETWNHEW